MTLRSLTWPIRSRYYKLRFFKSIWKYYCAPWEWVDGLMEIMFQAFEDFYKHGGLDNIDWNSDESHKEARQTMEEIHIFWTEGYKQWEEEIAELLHTWSEHHVSWHEEIDDDPIFKSCYRFECVSSKYGDYLFQMLHRHEEAFEKKKEEMLIKLISIRRSLWT